MANYLKSLSKKYDNNIRSQCNKDREKLINCMQEHFDDYFVCKELIINFHNCVRLFNLNFKKKYPNVKINN